MRQNLVFLLKTPSLFLILTNFMYPKIIGIMKNLKFKKEIVIDYESCFNYNKQGLKFEADDYKAEPTEPVTHCFIIRC